MKLQSIMTFMYAVAILLSSGTSEAANWVKFKECKTNQGSFWLDRATDGPWAQIVVQDDELIKYIVDQGAIDQGDLDFFNHKLVLGTYSGNNLDNLNFIGNATARAGKPGLQINVTQQGVRVSSGGIESHKCYCDGFVNGDLECIGTVRCSSFVLFDFTVTNCRSF
jgi:hypothetical protein